MSEWEITAYSHQKSYLKSCGEIQGDCDDGGPFVPNLQCSEGLHSLSLWGPFPPSTGEISAGPTETWRRKQIREKIWCTEAAVAPPGQKDWFNVGPAPRQPDKGTVSTITMKEKYKTGRHANSTVENVQLLWSFCKETFLIKNKK